MKATLWRRAAVSTIPVMRSPSPRCSLGMISAKSATGTTSSFRPWIRQKPSSSSRSNPGRPASAANENISGISSAATSTRSFAGRPGVGSAAPAASADSTTSPATTIPNGRCAILPSTRAEGLQGPDQLRDQTPNPPTASGGETCVGRSGPGGAGNRTGWSPPGIRGEITGVLSYTVDPGDRVVGIDGAWDEFAARNDAPGLTREGVTGRPLFDYVAGGETQEIVRILLLRVRSGRGVSVAFRCDAPSRRRFLRLEMRSTPDGSVRCSSTLLSEEARPPQPLLDPTVPRTGEFVHVCSWCRRVEVNARWLEVEEAVSALGLFQEPALPAISHGICPDCSHLLKEG